MDQQAREAREMAKNLPFRQRVQHFWYYHKWYVIVGVLAVLLAAYTIYQFVNTEHYDLEITCFTEYGMTAEQIARMEAYFSQFVEDINDDGTANVKIYPTVMSTSAGSADAAALQQKFIVELAAGSGMAYLFDEGFYQVMQTESYAEIVEAALRISDDAGLMESFGIASNAPPIYWVTKTVYQNEAEQEERVAMHDNAVRVQKALEERLGIGE